MNSSASVLVVLPSVQVQDDDNKKRRSTDASGLANEDLWPAGAQ